EDLPQALIRPPPEVAGIGVVVPDTMRREDEEAIVLEDPPGLGEVSRRVRDVFQDLGRQNEVGNAIFEREPVGILDEAVSLLIAWEIAADIAGQTRFEQRSIRHVSAAVVDQSPPGFLRNEVADDRLDLTAQTCQVPVDPARPGRVEAFSP